jgi:hypothetical protein
MTTTTSDSDASGETAAVVAKTSAPTSFGDTSGAQRPGVLRPAPVKKM